MSNKFYKRGRDKEYRLCEKYKNMGYDIDEKQYQDVLSPDKLKTLPEIQNFFQKSYKSCWLPLI
jgi:hypothetical protein